MVKIKIIAVGQEKDKNIKPITSEYYKRLSRWAEVQEIFVSEGKARNEGEIKVAKATEKDAILSKVEGFVVVLDRRGKMLSSEEFADKLSLAMTSGNSVISFVIGGSNGLDDEVIKSASLVISFGNMTLPHELMRAVLGEQIYRAFTIMNKIAYHK
ncbi:MAG: 23S rRNA (pseudouridine(1915)-N(3))-methyltransferase RlmH [Clostridia bacterium]|nr:23S rRNA (pseudouridine(1915)-N(3))-methyltransferase RlmH [Clostridia bacterium]